MNIHLVNSNTASEELVKAHHIHTQSQYNPWSYATFADCTTAPYYCVLAYDEDVVVGYAIVLEVVDEATLMDIAVDVLYRGQGVGKKLVEHVKKQSTNNGMASMWLEVRVSNEAAIKLYEKMHFEPIEVRKHYYQSETGKEDALIMKSELL